MKRGASRSRWYLIVGIFVLAAIVRLWGIGRDLPYSYYPDEAHFVNRALSFGSGDLNPHWFHKPAFYMYLLSVEYGLYFVVGYLVGCWASVSEFAVGFVQNPGPFYLIGRLTTVLFGLGCIWGVYCLGERHFAKGVGLIGGLLLALTFGHVTASQSVKADIPTTCFGIWATYFLLNYVANARRKDLFLACVLAGIGTATKYYTVVMLLPILVAVLLTRREEDTQRLEIYGRKLCLALAAVAVFSATFSLCAPYNVLDPLGRQTTFSHARKMIARPQEPIHGNPEARVRNSIGSNTSLVEGATDYFYTLCSSEGMGLVIAAISLVGIVYVGGCPRKMNAVFILYPVVFALLSMFTYPGYAHPRHQCPLYPFLAIGGAVVVERLARAVGRGRLIVYGALAMGLCYPSYCIVQNTRELTKEDTRNVAKAWVEANIPAGAKLLVDENGPNLQMSEERLRTLLGEAERAGRKGPFTAHYSTHLEYQLAAAKDVVSYDLYEIRIPWWRKGDHIQGVHTLDSEYDRDMANPLRPVGVEEYDFYVENGFQYALVHSRKYRGFFTKNSARSRRFPTIAKFYHELFQRGALVKEFSPEKDGLRGPVVKIFEFRR